MKYLVAFALFAVAVALPEPRRLLAPAPVEIAPLVVPQQVMDEIALTVKVVDAPEDVNAYAVNFVDEPVNADAAPAIEDPSAYAVNIVDDAVNADVALAIEDASAYAVHFVDEAVNAEAPAVKAVEDVPAYAVNFVDEAVNAEAAIADEDASAYAVHFVDEAINAEAPAVRGVDDVSAYAVNFVDEAVNVEMPAAIKIVEIPLPGSIVLPLDSIVLPSVNAVRVVEAPVESSDAVSKVKIVDVADEETPRYMPIKQYPDPRWR